MSVVVVIILIFFVIAAAFGAVAYYTYRRKLRRAKAIERGLKMVPILIHLPPPSSDTQSGNRDIREVVREKTAQAEVLYNLISGTATEGFKSKFYGQRHIALEVVAVNGVVHFFAAVPVALVSTITKAIQTAYPGARLEEVEDHNIFNQEGRLAATLGGEMVLRTESAYPVATYEKLERDPMEALLTTISALDKKDGVAVQVMLRPADSSWTKRSIQIANGKRKGRGQDLAFSAGDLAKAAIKSPDQRREEERARMGGGNDISNLQLAEIESIEEKTKHPGFEVLIRVIVSTQSVARSQQLLRDIANTFALFEKPGLNGFKFLPALDVQGLVTAFIFRFFPTEVKANVLNSVELATLFHLPDSQFTPSMSVERQMSKQVDGPVQLPTVGLLFGYNDFRGVKKEIRLSPEDRRRHTYILGQTGTGKSTMLENLAVQDMVAGNGFAFIDPHGDSAEKILAMVPKERAEDVIYFNPADTDYPLGLNLFEFKEPAQKDFIVQETINMLYKLYDPGHTGIIGPRYEHWYRNAALTLMSDPNGSTFIEIPKVFTDTDYLKQKFKYLKDPTVIDFWTKEMGQTSDYHKSEMLGWFVSKFGAFQNNEMMRNIVGQTKSSFNLRDVMDQQKILVVNLSKGRLGELNSQLLGMIFVIKFQAAAMSRADTPEQDRKDFSLYVDEFQNFSTDSFASILSEARKYRLNLIVANQFIGQLSTEIRDAVFGNIGTIVAHRMGPDDAEFMVKQFAPVFDASDLVNIPNFNAAMRLMIGGLPSQPFSVHDSAPLSSPNLELGLAIKQLSAAKYGHSRSVVEADILDRFSGHSVVGGLPEGAVADVPNASSAETQAPAQAPAPVMPAAAPVEPVAPVLAAQPVPAAIAPPVIMPAAPAPAVMPMEPVAPVQPLSPAPAPVPVSSPLPLTPAVNVSASGLPSVPPPIGAPPTAVGPAVGGSIAPATAGPTYGAPAPIIPEDNPSADADQMIQQGGFAAMGTPLQPDPAPSPQVAVAPSPIPAAAVSPSPGIGTLPPLTSPAPVVVAAPAAMPMMPPPIGAPPIDLPTEKTWQAPPSPATSTVPGIAAAVAASTPVSDSSTLSLRDITGGRPSARPPVDLSSITVMTPGTEPQIPVAAPVVPAVPVVAQIPAVPSPAPAPVVTLGSGHALPNDPFANIEVLGDLTPPVPPPVPADIPEPVPVAAPAAPPIGSGAPIAGDPYANIDVLGQTPMPSSRDMPTPVPVPAPVASVPAPVAPVTAPPVEAQISAVAAAPMALPVPAPSVPVQPLQPMPLSVQPAVEAPVVPAPVMPAPAAPLPMPPSTSISVAAPQPAAASLSPAPVAREPWPPVPETRQAPQTASAAADASSVPGGDGSLIHFVDPAAESILHRPDTPDRMVAENGEPSLSGLPEGVEIVHTPAATPAAIQVAAAVPEPVQPAPAAAAIAPAAELTPAPVAPPGPLITPAPKPELPHMASEPPPIGAAPVALPGQTQQAPPPPVQKPVAELPHMETEQPQTPAKMEHEPEAFPEPTAEPKLELPVEHAPAPKPAESVVVPREEHIQPVSAADEVKPESEAIISEAKKVPEVVPAIDQLESVAQMLDEEVKPKEQPVPSPTEKKPEEPATHYSESPRPAHKESSEEKPKPEPMKPVATPAPPMIKEAAPPVSQAAQIEKAEHEIDDLLSVSLIHSDVPAAHKRLPEPVEATPRGEERGGIDMEMNNAQPRHVEAPAGTPLHMAEHHGLKVLQPLEPIVPPKEQFAKELAALKGEAQVRQPAAPPPPPVPAPPAPKAEDKPPAEPVVTAPAAPTIVKHEANMLPTEDAPVMQGVVAEANDSGLPQAESLAADDVAKARAQREADLVMQKPAPAPAPAPAPQSAQPAAAPATNSPSANDAGNDAANKKRRRHRGGKNRDQGQPQQTPGATEDAGSAGSMAGKLILPTGEKPAMESVQPSMEKPKKLAPGEVYVDANGNVVTGD